MIPFVRLFRSSIGRKLIMALTGLGLLGFLLAHMAGNLLVFKGADALNTYAAFLKGHPLLWPARLGLLAIFAAHVGMGIKLTADNRAARGNTRYQCFHPRTTNAAARGMIVSGLLVLSFVVYHLSHFTLGLVDPSLMALEDAQGRHNVYAMVVAGFSHPLIAGSYIVFMVLLGLHLIHGARSMLQTFGVHHKAYNKSLTALTHGLVALIVIGNVSMPTAVLLDQKAEAIDWVDESALEAVDTEQAEGAHAADAHAEEGH